eukprot:GHVN01062197.1.p1 GENE.GHVN01062197.1~~GHVN01062197.1.p1  ORF type:complete len:125 (-),score=41.69 GHVN01062197.1:465-839(-)
MPIITRQPNTRTSPHSLYLLTPRLYTHDDTPHTRTSRTSLTLPHLTPLYTMTRWNLIRVLIIQTCVALDLTDIEVIQQGESEFLIISKQPVIKHTHINIHKSAPTQKTSNTNHSKKLTRSLWAA